jgi:hypothetical protein
MPRISQAAKKAVKAAKAAKGAKKQPLTVVQPEAVEPETDEQETAAVPETKQSRSYCPTCGRMIPVVKADPEKIALAEASARARLQKVEQEKIKAEAALARALQQQKVLGTTKPENQEE